MQIFLDFAQEKFAKISDKIWNNPEIRFELRESADALINALANEGFEIERNIAEMEDAVANVKTGQVTFAIKDTNIDGVEIKANDYMALVEKDIVACKPNKLDALKVCLEKLVDEDSELITLLVGEDVVDEEVEEIESYIEDNFDAEVDIIEGKQPVYSFIIGVE